jgi:hypothetical protein
MITLQADFTDQPEHIPELIKRFEGGADLVVGERTVSAATPQAIRRYRWLATWAVRAARRGVTGVTDPFGAMRLYRISLIRDLVRNAGDKPVVAGEGWSANLDLLRHAAPLARRMETVAFDPRYDLRSRETRIRPWSDSVTLFRDSRTLKPVAAAPTPARSAQ